MDWRHDYVDGNVRSSCSICGCSRRFPDNLTFCDDELFRCERCMEKTALAFDREIAAARQRREQPDVAIGIRPPWESTPAFATLAAQRRSELIPGWTPTHTRTDTFDTVPGDWSDVSLISGVSEVSDGVVQCSIPAAATTDYAALQLSGWPTGGLAHPNAGRFYMLCRFKAATTIGATSFISVGVIDSSLSAGPVGVGVDGPRSVVFYRFYQSGAPPLGGSVANEVDTEFHFGEVWWKGNGYVLGAIDFGVPVTFAKPTLAATPTLYMEAFRNGSGDAVTLQVSDLVAYA